MASEMAGIAAGPWDTGTVAVENLGAERKSVTGSGPVASIHSVAVTAVSPTDAWAVGHDENSTNNGTLIEHFDGTSWSVLPNPSVTSGSTQAAIRLSWVA